ncbi:hypothetical protein N7539_009041 [Penicillium diatomitis]|uniref:Uncharacterized protein n=1 Tax=Penicillium diatomitis TaxID=2819901 RepID=A0A9W9WL28_9EURO|nr:uncharacterized protein N7539_009041 [Penicillium diatomitis]KAJ5469423.1 hypothetical protein N7539_009041 [Penicillium diatomitis]
MTVIGHKVSLLLWQRLSVITSSRIPALSRYTLGLPSSELKARGRNLDLGYTYEYLYFLFKFPSYYYAPPLFKYLSSIITNYIIYTPKKVVFCLEYREA